MGSPWFPLARLVVLAPSPKVQGDGRAGLAQFIRNLPADHGAGENDAPDAHGGAFSLSGGLIIGRNIGLVPDQRIVQAWRPGSWDPGFHSIVKFEFRARDMQTKPVLDHTGFPMGDADGLDSGWKGHYLDPLAKFLA